MKKDREWAFIELGKLFPSHAEMYDHPDDITVMKCELLNKVYDILNQLDEPEVLSQEWIDRNKEPFHHFETKKVDYYVSTDFLQNLLVPKQELPVIPKFVAEWIEHNQEDDLSDTIHFIIYGLYADWPHTNSMIELRKPVLDWLSEDRSNYFKLIDASRYGYTVEEEQKYRVLDGNTTLLGRINGLMLTTVEILEYYPEYAPTFELTEQEIKDYDERYWPFAVKVEELEE